MRSITRLLKALAAVEVTDSTHNPYRSTGCRHNLTIYLEGIVNHPYSGHLLVGEAMGYRGGALTGIPFSSPRLLGEHPHPFLVAIRPHLKVEGSVSEATATMVWAHFATCQALPACWNVYPFHPHQPGRRGTNRRPGVEELQAGRRFFERILEMLSPHTVVAVGRVAQHALQAWHPGLPIVSVRHPSHGGKKEFVQGLREAGVQ